MLKQIFQKIKILNLGFKLEGEVFKSIQRICGAYETLFCLKNELSFRV